MNFIINETGVREELHIYAGENQDWISDLIGNSGVIGEPGESEDCIFWDEEKEAYRISQDSFDWWSEYVKMTERYAVELRNLKEQYGEDQVNEVIQAYGAFNSDLNSHTEEYAKLVSTIRDTFSD